jgi:outer membrane protein assembly factor BamA
MRIVVLIAGIVVLASVWVSGQVAAGIRIADVRFTGDTQLRDADLQGCATDVKTGRFEGPQWEAQAASFVKSVCLQDNGYFTAQVTSASTQLPDAGGTHQFTVTFTIEAGPQYRMDDVQFTGNHAIPANELRALFPLQHGEIFRLRAVRDSIALMKKAYKSRGYREWTPIPEFRFDKTKGLITILIDMDEGKYVK